VERLASTFRSTDGDIAAVLRELFASAEFKASLGTKFKDPVHYVVSPCGSRRRQGHPERRPDDQLLAAWESRSTRGPRRRLALTRTEWASAGQMATRFEMRAPWATAPRDSSGRKGRSRRSARRFPSSPNALYYASMQKTLAEPTRQALDSRHLAAGVEHAAARLA